MKEKQCWQTTGLVDSSKEDRKVNGDLGNCSS